MTKPHLILRFDAPLIAFGTTMIDNHGAVQDFPATSMITGLLANALGWRRTDAAPLQRMQDRLVHAVRLDRAGEPLHDFQTAELLKQDKGWTTRGAPEERAGGAGTYVGKHIRHRWYRADCIATIALRLEPAEEEPRLAALTAALDRPARPLFIGRKPCLPSGPILAGEIAAPTALDAVYQASPPDDANGEVRFFWPRGEGPEAGDYRPHTGRRNWRSGVHAGEEHWFGGSAAEIAP